MNTEEEDYKQAYESLIDYLKANKKTIATAESCTGGNIAHVLTMQAGSSAYFNGGVVSYANEVKTNVLHVNTEDIEKHGAVSQSVVEQMSRNVCKIMNTDTSIATSGIAGPGGGTPDKPVGTVWISATANGKTTSERHQFTGSRAEIIEKATQKAIFMLSNLVNQQKRN